MDLLTTALTREVEASADRFEQEWPGRRSLALELAAALFVPSAMFVGLALFVGIALVPEVFAFIAVVLVLAAAIPVRAHIFGVQRLIIDHEGITVVTRRGLQSTYWERMSGIGARSDLERLRLDRQGGPVTVDLHRLGTNERMAVMDAIRVHAPTLPIVAWNDTGRRLREPAFGVLATVAVLTLGGLFYEDYVGYSMGMRCSGPSAYMDQRFGVPDGPGCIVIGVSGAAERAGLRQGDKIIEQDGQPITSGPQFNDRFFDEDGNFLAVPPRKMRFVVLRGGEPEPLEITLTHGPGGGIDLPQDDPLYWFRKARARLGEDPEKGIAEYTRAIELAPDFELAYLYRGNLYLVLRDSQGAWADYRRALEINPEHGEAHRELGRLWANGTGDDLDLAMMHIREAIRIDGCQGGFERYNVDCRRDYLVLADLLDHQGDEVGASDARAQADRFYPE